MPARPIVLTFDDGYSDFHHVVLPALVEHGFPATVFVTTGWLRDAGRHAAGSPPDRMLSWAEVAELAEHGMEIGAHSHSHPQLDQIPRSRLPAELLDSRSMLQDRVGQAIQSLAYPYGYSNARVRMVAREAGHEQAAGVVNAAVWPDVDPFRVPRLTVSRTTSDRIFADLIECRRLGNITPSGAR